MSKLIIALLTILFFCSCTSSHKYITTYKFERGNNTAPCLKDCIEEKGGCSSNRELIYADCLKAGDSLTCDKRYYSENCIGQHKKCIKQCGGSIKQY